MLGRIPNTPDENVVIDGNRREYEYWIYGVQSIVLYIGGWFLCSWFLPLCSTLECPRLETRITAGIHTCLMNELLVSIGNRRIFWDASMVTKSLCEQHTAFAKN
mmetsp:Transcript_30668/g.45397  ORF Transcript_30668/g.45397 Transcript_30668/m.45397 type:complete len:104 (-) Transcript_30668:91-402(-)